MKKTIKPTEDNIKFGELLDTLQITDRAYKKVTNKKKQDSLRKEMQEILNSLSQLIDKNPKLVNETSIFKISKAHIDKLPKNAGIKEPTVLYMSPLYKMVSGGCKSGVKLLLEKKADINLLTTELSGFKVSVGQFLLKKMMLKC